MKLCRRLVVLLFAALLIAPKPAAAWQNKRNLAYTDAKKADADFALQGEFLGAVVENDTGKRIGLQVVAQGDGTFLGVEYAGGLPGTGWDKSKPMRMNGKIEKGFVYLSNAQHQFYVGKDKAHVYDQAGESLGTIPRVERISPTIGKKPPANAIVLFDGKDNGQFQNPRITPEGLLTEGTQTTRPFKDFTLHIEFKLPYMPYARGQGRGNSGVYLQSRYEVQILDSFGLKGVHNECGGLYRQRPPALNMCLPPLQWQTYDITLTSPKFDRSGKKTANGRITVRHNGVLIHDNVELKNKTGAGRPEGPKGLPTKLQNHRNPVRFRNVWLVEHGIATKTRIVSR